MTDQLHLPAVTTAAFGSLVLGDRYADDIAKRTGLPAEQITTALESLEHQGLVWSELEGHDPPRRRYARRRDRPIADSDHDGQTTTVRP